MTKARPKKQKEKATGPRRINGFVLDIKSGADFVGWTEKTMRSRVGRGRVPFRRDGGRIIFLRDELEDFLRKLPGVDVKEALANERAVRGAADDD